MGKNIYDILNDNTIDLDELDREEFSEIEKKRIKKKFKKSIYRKKNNKPMVAAAIAGAIIVGAIGVTSPTDVVAAIKTIATDIATFLRIQKDLSSYKTVVGKTIDSDSVSITLNEVILDGEDLLISSTVKTDRKLLEPKSITAEARVYINGESLGGGVVGTGKKIDDFTFDQLIEQSGTTRDFKGKLDVKIVYTHVRLGTGDYIAIDPCVFEFTTSGDELASDTLEVPLDYKFELEGGDGVILNNYIGNVISEKIYFTYENNKRDGISYDMELRGHDDLGNEVLFYMESSHETGGVFKRDESKGKNENANTITLAPYAAYFLEENEGLKDNYIKKGEEFTIKIN